MFCIKCGKEIPNDAQFCNFCGNKVHSIVHTAPPAPQAQPSSKPASSQASSEHQAAPASAVPAKKKSWGGRLFTLILCVCVYFLVRNGVEGLFSGDFKIGGISKSELIDDASRGGIYKDGYLTYGLARLHAPGYTVVKSSSSNGDYLLSSDSSKLIRVNLNIENDVSFSATTKESIQNSYIFNVNISDAKVQEFSKYKVEGFNVVEYIISCKVGGVDEYIGELIVFPSSKPSSTLRFSMESLSSNGIRSISSVFDTLDISKDYDYELPETHLILYPEKRITEN